MMANHHLIGASLNEFLTDHADSCILYRKRVRARIQALINPILASVKEEDPTLDLEPLDVSSFFLAIKSRQVYEVHLNLRRLSAEDFTIEDGQTAPGYALVKIKGKEATSDWRKFSGRCNPEKMYLSAKTISEKLLERIKSVLKKRHIADEMVNLKVHEELIDNGVALQVHEKDTESCFVTLIPSISCDSRWTCSAGAWLNEHSHWPNKTLKQETIKDGFALVGKACVKKSAYQWRIMFPKPTKRLIQADMGCRNKCLSVLEIILENTRYVPRGVDQFHVKTLVLHLAKKFPVQEFWTEDKFGQRFTDLLLFLQRCLIGRRLDDFFLPGMNLFHELEEPTFQIWELQVKELLQDVDRFLQDFENVLHTTAL